MALVQNDLAWQPRLIEEDETTIRITFPVKRLGNGISMKSSARHCHGNSTRHAPPLIVA
jgi:hypothetical protein